MIVVLWHEWRSESHPQYRLLAELSEKSKKDIRLFAGRERKGSGRQYKWFQKLVPWEHGRGGGQKRQWAEEPVTLSTRDPECGARKDHEHSKGKSDLGDLFDVLHR